MKKKSNCTELIKEKLNRPHKKLSHPTSIMEKEINFQINQIRTKNNHIKVQKQREQIKTSEMRANMTNKKTSGTQLRKKSSKILGDICEYKNVIQRFTNNFIKSTINDTIFELDDAKHEVAKKNNKKDLIFFKEQSEDVMSQMKEVLGEKKKTRINLDGFSSSCQMIQKSLFQYEYIIGKGGFGKVWRIEHRKSRIKYAVKQMVKSMYKIDYCDRVMTKKSVQSILNERVLLSQINSPFLVNMHYAFQDRDLLYLVLDLMEGGDLRYHLTNTSFTQVQAKFFIACIILGLEDLHQQNIIHRDIKPENLVLDARGYIRVTDLGIARIHKLSNSSDTSGTPGYMSPEVICRQNHTFVSDYFAVGVIAYQIMTGKRPYQGHSRAQIRDLMLAKQIQIRSNEIPSNWSPEAASFINKLIQRKPENRLGYSGIKEIKDHPWITGLNWQRLKTKKIQSPFVPEMKKGNFDQDEQITIEDEEQGELIQKNALLLRKVEFQDLFQSYYYDRNQIYPMNQKDVKIKSQKNKPKKMQHELQNDEAILKLAYAEVVNPKNSRSSMGNIIKTTQESSIIQKIDDESKKDSKFKK